MSDHHDLAWDQRQRFLLLEARLIWSGGAAPADLAQTFGVSLAQAEKDFEQYQARCPGNLQFELPAQRYQPTDRFEPAFLRGTAQEFLRVLRLRGAAGDSPLAVVAAELAPAEILDLPEREFDVRVLQRVTAALREQRWLAVEYQSMTHPEPRRLEIAPHALAYAGRWHARAWSASHGAYRDFLLSRMLGLPELLGRCAQNPQQDWDWRNYVSVKIGAHPALTAAQKRMVEADYGMQNGILEKSLRLALVPYYLRLLGVHGDSAARDPVEQPIVLLNRSELAAYDRLG